METYKFIKFKDKIIENVSKVIVGKEDTITYIIVSIISGGHVLLEDLPGLGKTKLAKTLSKTLNCSFKRVQFTPDLLPSDITGVYFYNQKIGEFELKEGPIVSNIILADEINRATPRTQAALLECMEEKQVTIEGNTLKLQTPFLVIATQNPIEQYGTFELPEAQIDRFFMRLSLGYPEYIEEKHIMDRFLKDDPFLHIESNVSIEEIEYVQENYVNVYVDEEIKKYILDIVTETRKREAIEMGVSPRGTLNLMKGAQAYAAINGRDYVIPEDVRDVAIPILAHRIKLKNCYNTSQLEAGEKAIQEILNYVKAPLESVQE